MSFNFQGLSGGPGGPGKSGASGKRVNNFTKRTNNEENMLH